MTGRSQGARSSRAGSVSKKDRKRMAWLDRECSLAKAKSQISWDRPWLMKFYSYWHERFKKMDAKRLALRLKMKGTKSNARKSMS